MNRHFKDAWYHLKRAGEESRLGVSETVSPIERELRTTLGLGEPEPTRSEQLKSEFETLRHRTEQESEQMVIRARSRLKEELKKKRMT